MYYATDGENSWYNNDKWLSRDHECDWYTDEEDTVACDDDTHTEYRVFRLEEHNLRGTIPDEIALLSTLQTLDLYDNRLTETIPSALGKLTNLSLLDLDATNFTGYLPLELKQLTKLNNFGVWLNDDLGGELSSEMFASWRHMRQFDISENKFQGTVPKEIDLWKDAVYLQFYDNWLEGELPEGLIAAADTMQKLYLDHNRFNGTVPSSWGNFTKLRMLTLHWNDLSGSVPDELCHLVQTKDLNLTIDCDKVQCSCGCYCAPPLQDENPSR